MPFQIETFKLLSVVRAMRMIANTQQQTPEGPKNMSIMHPECSFCASRNATVVGNSLFIKGSHVKPSGLVSQH